MPKPTSLFVVLVVTIAGYYFLINYHKTRYSIKRSNGYHTFLSSAGVGLGLMAISTILYAISNFICVQCSISFSLGSLVLSSLFQSGAAYSEMVLFDVACITLVLSLILPILYYHNQEKQYDLFLLEFSSDCESPEYTKLFFSSFEYGLPILFTMSDRKVYIGYVLEIQAKNFNDVHVLPIFSGYRDKDSLKLVPVTPYFDVLHDVENIEKEEIDLEAFSICLPLREIMYAHLHDFDYYKKFKEKEEDLEILEPATKFTYTAQFVKENSPL